MKKLLTILSTALLAACSNIADEDRLIFVSTVEDLLTADTTVIQQRILIEDFTGQACVNCPAATELITELQELYGEDNVIAVGLYSGYFGKNPTSGALYPLTTETGNYYYDKFGVEVQPSAMINRHGVNSNTASWATEVYTYIQPAAPLALNIINTNINSARACELTVVGEATDPALSGYLCVWLTEDGVVSPQYLADGSINSTYVHNHVFRASLTDLDGDPVSGSFERSYTITLDDSWDLNSLALVAFVYDDVVLQCVRQLIEN